MKNRIIICLTIVLLLCTSCGKEEYVSREEYNNLASRVELLEKKMELLTPTSESDSKPSSSVVQTEVKNEEESKDSEHRYSLDDMTAEDMYREIISIITNEPYDGQTYENYKESFRVIPSQMEGYDDLHYSFVDYNDYGSYWYLNSSYIESFYIRGPYKKMDGTIGMELAEDQYFSYNLQFVVNDYEKAVALYDLLVEYTKGLGYENFEDSRVTSEWRANAHFKITDHSSMGVSPVTMTRDDREENLFRFTVNILKK